MEVGDKAESQQLDELVVAAAYLHDIGYAVPHTKFHPLDGAVFLQEWGWPDQIVQMVAYHTGAEIEADVRGLANELAAIPRPDQSLIDAVTCCDMTTTPVGATCAPGERIEEILVRYQPGHQVYTSVHRSTPYLLECCERHFSRNPQARQLGHTKAGKVA